ncbi:MAG: 4Fe-4S dicluster domain-containing protein [Chloroflexi bacterium]|nr:4Fe-4S dicluster domain-containing protein [Chloroflexota bacterium]
MDERNKVDRGKPRDRDNVRQRDALSRRQFLKVAGAGAVGIAVAGSGLAVVTAAARAADKPGPTGGDHLHPADATTSTRLRRWAMVIDLRSCDGCQSQGTPPQCTTACIQGHFAPEPIEWIQIYEHELPGGGTQFIPTPCQQCQNPPCVNVCPVGATWSTPEGVVLIDADRCIGCRMCMAACPYDRRFFTWTDPPKPPEAAFAQYHPERNFPLRKGVTSKCVFCPDLARAGRLPYCAQGCPNQAIYYGDLEEDLATNGKDVVALSKFLSENQTYRLKEDLGTKPRVFYIPGHGQAVGRDPFKHGRKPTEWPWMKNLEGAKTWTRSG